jgi:hypothetical protein
VFARTLHINTHDIGGHISSGLHIDPEPYMRWVQFAVLSPVVRLHSPRISEGVGGERPDAILVNDDYLVEAVTQGVLDAGRRVPEDVVVVAQCNFPHLPPAVTPVVRLGYDLPDLMDRALAALLEPEPPTEVVAPLMAEAAWQVRRAAAEPALPVPLGIAGAKCWD